MKEFTVVVGAVVIVSVSAMLAMSVAGCSRAPADIMIQDVDQAKKHCPNGDVDHMGVSYDREGVRYILARCSDGAQVTFYYHPVTEVSH